jgi:hypothetical protein
MKFEDIHNLMQKPEVKPDTYEASMALNQLLKIGTHAIKIHNMIDDDAEMEAWVAKKIDLASNYVKSVHGYTAGEKAGTYDDNGMTENVRYPIPTGKVVKKFATDNPDTKFVLSQNPNGKFRVTYNMDVNIGGVAKTGAQTQTVNGATGEFDNANDAIAAGKKDAADYYKDELVKSKQPRQPDPPFNLEDWSTDKVQEFGGDLIRLAKGQPIDMGGYDSYGYELDDGRPDDDDDEGNEAASDSIGGEVTSAIKMHRDYIDNMYYDKQVDPDKVKPNKETMTYAQAIIRKPEFKKAYQSTESVSEDAGEGHMSKSQLYQTAKMAIELLDMIKKGDDLEGWVQTKLNLAADYLQAVYHYEDYQKLNPYREEIDSNTLHRHAGIIQKHLDEILERKCRAEDVDTKPGMMRILKKRVNEVEKELAKKGREHTNEGVITEDPRAVGRALANLKYAKAMANGIIKGDDIVLLRPKAQAFLSSADETIDLLDKMYAGPTNEDAHLEEGMKEWAKKLAMAGVIVAGLAGIGSVNDAINNSVPAIKAMNTALEMAEKSGNDELAKMIEKDLRDAKVRLDSGRDLPYVKDLQDKYAKFMTTEGLNFESRLAVRLEQRIK